VCETQDFYNNSLGAAVAMALAALVNAFLPPVSPPADAGHVASGISG
jgi:hypothetical protein